MGAAKNPRPEPVDTGIEPHVSSHEAAAALGITLATLHGWMETRDPRARALRPWRIGRRWRYPVSALREAQQRAERLGGTLRGRRTRSDRREDDLAARRAQERESA